MTSSLPDLSFQPFDQVNPQVVSEPVLDKDIDATVKRLQSVLWADYGRLQWYDAYHEGEQPLRYMSEAMASEVRGLLSAVVLNWPRLGAEMYANRLRIDGFRYQGSAAVDASLMDTWQANGLDALFGQAALESLILSRSYLIVGAPDTPGGEPIVTVESPFQVTAYRNPRTRRVEQALKMWQDSAQQAYATLYEPNRTVSLVSDGSAWRITNVDDHELGMVPVVPLVNRPRILRPNGVSEFHDIIPIVDAAIKAATDMMVSAEYHAMPRRWVFGMKKSDFKDQNGNQVSAWSRIAGRIWSHENENVKTGQYAESDLRNFHDTIKLLARLAAQVLAAPEALTFDSVNPPSAEAFGAMNAERSMRIRSKQVTLGEAAEDTMRLVLRIKTGSWDPKANSLSSVWADPDIMTFSQKADGIVKLVTAQDGRGRSVITVEQAREDLGYDAIARDRMRKDDESAQVTAMQALQDMAAQQTQPDVTANDANVVAGG